MSTTSILAGNGTLARASFEADHNVPEAGRLSLWAQLKSQFYGFLERLPERQSDIDRSFYKRPPMPF